MIDDLLIFTGTLEKSKQQSDEYQTIRLYEHQEENQKMLFFI